MKKNVKTMIGENRIFDINSFTELKFAVSEWLNSNIRLFTLNNEEETMELIENIDYFAIPFTTKINEIVPKSEIITSKKDSINKIDSELKKDFDKQNISTTYAIRRSDNTWRYATLDLNTVDCNLIDFYVGLNSNNQKLYKSIERDKVNMNIIYWNQCFIKIDN